MSNLLPENYAWVFGGLFASYVANVSLMRGVGAARRKYKIKLPTMYADASHIDNKNTNCKSQADVDAYNSAQRAHQNTVENLATTQLFGALSGLMFPRFAGSCLVIYSVGRVIYGRGYRTNGPSGRMVGALISHLGDVPLALSMAYCAAALAGWVSAAGPF